MPKKNNDYLTLFRFYRVVHYCRLFVNNKSASYISIELSIVSCLKDYSTK